MCARGQILGDGVRAVCPTGPTMFLQETIFGRAVALEFSSQSYQGALGIHGEQFAAPKRL